MDEIGQFEQNWTIRTEFDTLDNFDKIGQFGQFRKNGQYGNLEIGQKIDKSGQNWTIWTTLNCMIRTKLDNWSTKKLKDGLCICVMFEVFCIWSL